MNEHPPVLVIAIPAFNEVETLRAAVIGMLRQVDRLQVLAQIRIIDDGSTDGTAALADALMGEDDRVTVRHHPGNRGFSGAIRSALAGDNADYVLLMPADGQVPPSILPVLWERRSDADVVVGLRRPRADSIWRRTLSRGFHTLSRILLGIPLEEFSSVLLFRREIVQVPTTSCDRSAAVLAEIMCRAHLSGARFLQVPYRHLPRAGGRGKGGDPHVAIRTLFELLRLAWTVRYRRSLDAAPRPRARRRDQTGRRHGADDGG